MEHIDLLRQANILCVDLKDPDWDNARGFLFDESSSTLYFPLSDADVALTNLDEFKAIIWATPKLIVTGSLKFATDVKDIEVQQSLAKRSGLNDEQVLKLLFDGRSGKPRSNRRQLAIRSLQLAAEIA